MSEMMESAVKSFDDFEFQLLEKESSREEEREASYRQITQNIGKRQNELNKRKVRLPRVTATAYANNPCFWSYVTWKGFIVQPDDVLFMDFLISSSKLSRYLFNGLFFVHLKFFFHSPKVFGECHLIFFS